MARRRHRRPAEPAAHSLRDWLTDDGEAGRALARLVGRAAYSLVVRAGQEHDVLSADPGASATM
jgi:hypothetical protein